MILFCLVCSQHPPGPATVSQPISFITDSYVKNDPEWLRLSRQQKLAASQSEPNTHTWRGEAQYKYHHDRTVHIKPNFLLNKWVFVSKPPLFRSTSTEERIATASYFKLQPRKVGSFRIIILHSHSIVIDKDVVSDTASVHTVAAAPVPKSSYRNRRPGAISTM